MSEMVKRVAKAIVKSYMVTGPDALMIAEEMARIAIKAMRNPTKSMVVEGEATIYEHTAEAEEWSLESTRNGWQAMIDDALKATAPEQS